MIDSGMQAAQGKWGRVMGWKDGSCGPNLPNIIRTIQTPSEYIRCELLLRNFPRNAETTGLIWGIIYYTK